MEKMNREAKLSFVGQRDEVPDLCNRVDSPATLPVFQPVRTETVSGSAALERGSRSAWACHCSSSLNVHAQSVFAYFLLFIGDPFTGSGVPHERRAADPPRVGVSMERVPAATIRG
jgi:hypothetical protein